MRSPNKRKRTEKHCPINVRSLFRRWERGDRRINWPKIETLLDRWERGEKIPWRKLSHTFIKKGPIPARPQQEITRVYPARQLTQRQTRQVERIQTQLNNEPDDDFLQRLQMLIQEDNEAADILARNNPH